MEWIPRLEEKHFFCHKCKSEQKFEVKLQRADTCASCGADLHCCKNCEHWDPSAHNQCKEKIAEYIPDREKANFCTFFSFKNGIPVDSTASKEKAKAALEALFKK